jgi:hypothetical protein
MPGFGLTEQPVGKTMAYSEKTCHDETDIWGRLIWWLCRTHKLKSKRRLAVAVLSSLGKHD